MTEAMPERPCGDCAVCCTHKSIDQPGFVKPPGVSCEHCTGTGCGVYETRPQICRVYRCGWKTVGWIPEAMRPDVSGVVIDFGEPEEPGYELEATLFAWRDAADLERHPAPDIIASLVENGVLTHIVLPGPPGMLGAKTAVNGRLAEAVRRRDAALLFAELRAAVQALAGAKPQPFRSRRGQGRSR